MGMSPSASLVFGIDITDVSWPEEVADRVEQMDVIEAFIDFLAHKDGFSGDDPEGHLAESRNLTVVQCAIDASDYRVVLAVSSAEFSSSGWGNWKRLSIEQPTETDVENLRWALDALEVSPPYPDPAWMLFNSFG